MGKIESRGTKNLKASLNCNVKEQIECPICNKVLKGKITFNQLNIHLRQCDYMQQSKLKNKNLSEREFKGKSHKNLGLNNFQNMLDNKYLNNHRKSYLDNNLNSSAPRGQHKKSINSSGEQGDINEFQLVIDYNNTKNHDLYEEKIKNEGNKAELYDKYSEMRKFLNNKKKLMNYNVNIECKNKKELFTAIKNCNIYYNTKFILLKSISKKTGIIKKPQIYNLNLAINKYIDIMIKNNIFFVKENTFYFPFNSQLVDFEMIGIVLSALFIYPEIKMKYCLPLILCKILVNQRLDLRDIKNANDELYNKLFDLTRDKNIKEKGLVYFYEGNELLIDGKNIKVDEKNVYDYIEKLINYEIRKYKDNIIIIKKNLFNLIPKKYIFVFNGEELYRIINRTL